MGGGVAGKAWEMLARYKVNQGWFSHTVALWSWFMDKGKMIWQDTGCQVVQGESIKGEESSPARRRDHCIGEQGEASRL